MTPLEHGAQSTSLKSGEGNTQLASNAFHSVILDVLTEGKNVTKFPPELEEVRDFLSSDLFKTAVTDGMKEMARKFYTRSLQSKRSSLKDKQDSTKKISKISNVRGEVYLEVREDDVIEKLVDLFGVRISNNFEIRHNRWNQLQDALLNVYPDSFEGVTFGRMMYLSFYNKTGVELTYDKASKDFISSREGAPDNKVALLEISIPLSRNITDADRNFMDEQLAKNPEFSQK